MRHAGPQALRPSQLAGTSCVRWALSRRKELGRPGTPTSSCANPSPTASVKPASTEGPRMPGPKHQTPRDAKEHPESFRVPGVKFNYLGTDFGPMIETHSRSHWLIFLNPASSLFGRSRYLLACHYCCHGVQDSQGRRVPAVALTILSYLMKVRLFNSNIHFVWHVFRTWDVGHPRAPRNFGKSLD